MQDMQSHSSDKGRWARAVMLMSLDVAVPFFPLMGLRVNDPVSLMGALRNYIREYRQKFYRDDTKSSALAVNDVIRFLDSQMGFSTAKEFQYWVTHLYCEGSREHGELQDWTLVLRTARRSEQQWGLFFPARLREEALQRFNESTKLEQFGSLLTTASHCPLSDWDLHLYAINLWNDELPDCPNGPQSQIYPIVVAAQGYCFWAWLLPQLSSIELESMYAAGRRLVESTPDLQFIQNIASPTSLLLSSI